MSFTKFRRLVWTHFGKEGRHDLPWRATRDPYYILVSEVMLQQTQVQRALPFYEAFIQRFPTVEVLAEAPLRDVLTAWQGLGYNRRAKMLWLAAQTVKKLGAFPKEIDALEELPGVGPYTARAVATFAYNIDASFVETNIRTAVIYHFFPKKKKVSDAAIVEVLTKALPAGRARAWYSALMDYGAHLKQSGVRLNAKSRHYTKQSTFSGSNREARGAIVRELTRGAQTASRLRGLLGVDRGPQMRRALQALQKEGLVEREGRRLSLSN